MKTILQLLQTKSTIC